MGRPHGRARVSAQSPSAFACCQRCGLWYNLNALSWQFQYSGTQLINTNLLFCDHCLDIPNPQMKARVIPPDPIPVLNARIEPFNIDETDYRYTISGLRRVTMDGSPRVTQGNY